MERSRLETISKERGEDEELEREGIGLCCRRHQERGSRGTERREESEASRSERERVASQTERGRIDGKYEREI